MLARSLLQIASSAESLVDLFASPPQRTTVITKHFPPLVFPSQESLVLSLLATVIIQSLCLILVSLAAFEAAFYELSLTFKEVLEII